MNKAIKHLLVPLLGFLMLPQPNLMAEAPQPNINIQASLEILQELRDQDEENRLNAIEQVVQYPNRYAPPVLYLLANLLFSLNRKPDAIFWLAVAQIRAHSDAAKTGNSKAAEAAIVALDQAFAIKIDDFAFLHLALLRQKVTEAILWDARQQRHYDPRWIALADSGAEFKSSHAWVAINEETRKQYFQEFLQVFK